MKTSGIVIVCIVVLATALAVGAYGVRAGIPRGKNADAINSSSKARHLWHCGMHPQVIKDHPGDCPICHMALTPLQARTTASAEKQLLYWWDPMLGASSISDKPGRSAMGMELVPVYPETAGPVVSIDPTLVQNMGVRTAKVSRGPLTKSVRTVGVLRLAEPGLHDINLKVGGWIEKLYANQEGMHVNAGDALFDLYSPELQVAEQELLSAVRAEKQMIADAGDPARQDAQQLIESATQKLRLWGIADDDIQAIADARQAPRSLPIRSPVTGYIQEKVIVQGSAVQAGMKLLQVADHSSLWLEAQIYPRQLPAVRSGQEVEATIDGLPGRTFKGALTFIAPHIDPMTRTLTVRMTVANPTFELKPGMFASAQIVTQPLPDTIQIPREALIDTGKTQIAFVVEGDGHFSPRKVSAGLVGDNDTIQIISGLAPDETVVTSGQFLMDVESRTIEATQKLLNASGAMESAATINETTTSPASNDPPKKADELVVVYCPMAKARWLQRGDTIMNPYMGQKMSDCGEAGKKLPPPAGNSSFDGILKAYLQFAAALESDKLDTKAGDLLKAAAGKLDAEGSGKFQDAVKALADTKDLKGARASFKTVSEQLISMLVDHAE